MVRAFDRVQLMQLDGLDLAFAQRELFESAVVMGKAALKASGHRQGRGGAGRARISHARLRPTRAAGATGDLHAGVDRVVRRRPVAPRGGSPQPRLGGAASERCSSSAWNDRVDHVPVRAVAAFHVDMRFLVRRAALVAPGARAMPLGSPLRSSGASVAAGRALGKDVDRSIEPDGDRAFVEELARAWHRHRRRRRWRSRGPRRR